MAREMQSIYGVPVLGMVNFLSNRALPEALNKGSPENQRFVSSGGKPGHEGANSLGANNARRVYNIDYRFIRPKSQAVPLGI
jgi:hypothetical protein